MTISKDELAGPWGSNLIYFPSTSIRMSSAESAGRFQKLA
jgi:hypothetical protein